ncbi:hypothetical protein KDW40_25410 [Burkholderia cenocepacia]|uniref:hypothetical protein n=1 Tax=Burkholderia cenocepacia TaxID=95486 RepID=UPI001BA36246|nr:hypothetical protein [Burkholderia cenocepacia]MBR8043480.1 hypothetical protein [Burkholderia cenocepacia]MBR8329069.1 hypothetical protein [Burkholderia cenocepacia]
MNKLMIVAALSLATMNAPAVAQGNANQTPTSREEFFALIAKKSPDVAIALHAFGRDYAAKCGAEPTVGQYEQLEGRSPAFTYRLAVGTLLGSPDSSMWTDKEHAQYASLMQEVKCLVPSPVSAPVASAPASAPAASKD